MMYFSSPPDKSRSGIIAIEALFGIMFFMFFMLTMFSYMVLFMAQNMIGHAMIQTADSLALESYGIEKNHDKTIEIGDLAVAIVEKLESGADHQGADGTDTGEFSTKARWFDKKESGRVPKIVEERFEAYFAGGPERTKEILNVLHVHNLEFKDSKVENQDLVITASYDIDLLFGYHIGSHRIGKYQTSQQVVSRLWSKGDGEN